MLSILIHLGLYGGWIAGKRLGWWDHQATWLLDLLKSKKKVALVAKPLTPAPPSEITKEIPLAFIEVDPEVAVPEPPKDARFYGAANAAAANPEPELASAVPKAPGKQEQVPRMADVPRNTPPPKENPFPLAPTPAPQEKRPEPEAPKPAEDAMEFAKARLKETPIAEPIKPITPPEKAVMPVEPRPRTLQEARRRLNIPGAMMKQEGGTQRRGSLSFDVRATEFGAYDAAFIAAVQKRWYDLLDNTPFAQRSGKVVIEFRLTYDGQITDIRTESNEVGENLGLLCQRAILDPAPYAPWPSDMRRKMGNTRDVTFTFYYN